MLLGYTVSSNLVVVLGIVTLALTAFQLLEGKRFIRFKGRTHMKVHRWSAYALLAIGIVHGLLALIRINFWTIG